MKLEEWINKVVSDLNSFRLWWKRIELTVIKLNEPNFESDLPEHIWMEQFDRFLLSKRLENYEKGTEMDENPFKQLFEKRMCSTPNKKYTTCTMDNWAMYMKDSMEDFISWWRALEKICPLLSDMTISKKGWDELYENFPYLQDKLKQYILENICLSQSQN